MAAVETPSGPSWLAILSELGDLIELDLYDRHRVDLTESRFTVSWQWWRTRVEGLLTAPISGYDPEGKPVYTTRVQRHMWR